MGLSLLKDGVVAIFNAALNVVEAVRDIASFLGKQLFKIFGLVWDNPYLGLATSIAVGAAVYQLATLSRLDGAADVGLDQWTLRSRANRIPFRASFRGRGRRHHVVVVIIFFFFNNDAVCAVYAALNAHRFRKMKQIRRRRQPTQG